ncbi:sigma-70 family RNA polymerase sigma factor [Saccharothrix syringae]|uniref:sigma-70 family RNA polymerase sigma factor n=1 Tax=Saccharothrix syringae TaxID=103733 RepID=UPI001476B776|nr:sigma-70 family RNA polymerase sigma factor [Saccharothrix syringae]
MGSPPRGDAPVTPAVRWQVHDPSRALLDDPHLTGSERAELVEALERAARHLADGRLYARIAAQGFTGFAYDALAFNLTAYALPVMLAWLRRGRIFAECAAKGRGLPYGDRGRERLARSRDDRLELAGETIAKALNLFRKLAVAGRGWSADGGTALTTYFVGTCVQVFPNVWRHWIKEQGWTEEQGADLLMDDLGTLMDTTDRHLDTHTDPAEIAASRDVVRTALDAMPGPVREVAELLILHGWKLPEVAAYLGTSPGAVEQRLRRYRRQLARKLGQDAAGSFPTSRAIIGSGDR